MSAAPPIVSYAQHHEDVRLARCFPGLTQGFYIDVGAWHPMTDSVTCHFYYRGWNGINVEPTPDAFALLERYRPRDVNLACLVGSEPGEDTIHIVDGSGLSTTSEHYAARAEAAGLSARRQVTPRRTLAEICTAHAPDMIHFLKVDVEGGEPAVLAGNDWARWRPVVVVVEGTEPNSPVRTGAAYTPILEKAGSRHATVDGLNDFFVPAERTDLAERLDGPITPFECAGHIREWTLSDVGRGGPLGRWLKGYQHAMTADILGRDTAYDIAAYLRALGLGPEVQPSAHDIARAYPLVLGRDADEGGIAVWSALIEAERLPAVAFLQRFCGSEEYMARRLAAEVYLGLVT